MMHNNYLPAKQADTNDHIQIEVLPQVAKNKSPILTGFKDNNNFNAEPETIKNSEEFPLVAKGHSPTTPPVVQSLSDSKAVTITFKDLSYSVLVKNDQKLSKSDPKCKNFIINMCLNVCVRCKQRDSQRNDWHL